MGFQTKLNLSNNKFEQTSGTTLNLNGSLSTNAFSANTISLSQSQDTQIIFNNGGSLSGNTGFIFDGATQSLTHGNRSPYYGSGQNSVVLAGGNYGVASGENSLAIGYNTYSYGESSIAVGKYSISCGVGSLAFATGRVYSDYSFAALSGSRACGYGSFAFSGGEASGQASIAFSSGNAFGYRSVSVGVGADACGCRSIIFNSAGGTALASDSSIFGSNDSIIESGNTNATIVGGLNINLTGNTYVDTTAVGKLAIMNQPDTGSSGDTILVRDSSTGIIRQINQSGLTGGGGTSLTFNNGLIQTGDTVSLGGVLTGDTSIDSANSNFVIGGNNTLGGSTNNNIFGFDNTLTSDANRNVIIGNSATSLCGTNSVSIAGGSFSTDYTTSTPPNSSVSMLPNSCVIGSNSFASNAASVRGSNSFGLGYYVSVDGDTNIGMGSKISIGGYNNIVIGNTSGFGFSEIRSTGAYGSSNNSIFGGSYNVIRNDNSNITIVGGSYITVNETSTDLSNHTIVGNLAINDTPTNGSNADTILVRNSTNGIIRQIPQSGLSAQLNILNVSGVTGSTLTENNYVLVVDTSTASQTVTLPSAPSDGLSFKIKDNGNALANNITIDGNAKNIDGAGSVLINTNYGAYEVVYHQTDDAWYILSFNN